MKNLTIGSVCIVFALLVIASNAADSSNVEFCNKYYGSPTAKELAGKNEFAQQAMILQRKAQHAACLRDPQVFILHSAK